MRAAAAAVCLIVIGASFEAGAEERKLYLSISAQGGGLFSYQRYDTRNELGPALVINAYVTAAYRVSAALALGGTGGVLIAPLGARIRDYDDGRSSDTTLGVGAGAFIGGNLSVFLQERVVLETALGVAGIGSPGVYGGFGPAINETLAFRMKGEGDWKSGFDVRLLAVVPSFGPGSARQFGMMMALTVGFSIALQ